jgi:hypothetical protein
VTGHTDRFAEHVARRDTERATQIKVTWRKVSPDTGGGWSGLGPAGALVFVRPAGGPGQGQSHYEFGRVEGSARVYAGTAATLPQAKLAAAALFTHDAATPQEEDIMATTQENVPTAESLVEGIGTAVPAPGKATYARLRTEAGTLAYALPRKYGVVLDFTTASVEGAPKRFAPSLERHGVRTTMRVTTKNAKAAADLLAWVARQLG